MDAITFTMDVITNDKGNQKLLFGGYGYNDKTILKCGNARWRCSQKGTFKCSSALTTDPSISNVVSSTDHTHEPDFNWTKGQLLRHNIKSNAKSSRGRPNQIVTSVLSKAGDVEAAISAGTKDSLRQVVRRVQRGDRPKNPPSIEQIPVPFPNEYAEYLIYDNEDLSNRIIIFASDAGLELLGSSEKWFMDGTYFTCPSQFEQLFIIRAPLGDTCATAVYAYLPSKTKDVYKEMLESIVSACKDRNIILDPVQVVADYEIGIHNAVLDVFENEASISGCFYHLTQSTWRRVQNEGLQSLYNADQEVREFCGKIDGLAFLPVNDVKEGIKVLYDEAPEHLRCLVEYFDTNYVNGGFKVSQKRNDPLRARLRRIPPKFAPHVWNVHCTTLEGGDRTNNQCESFNNAFKQLVGCSNPSLWLVSECIWEDIRMVSIDIVRASRGVLPKKRIKKGTMIHQRQVKRLCEKYNNKEKNLQQFLKAIGKSIRIAKKKSISKK